MTVSIKTHIKTSYTTLQNLKTIYDIWKVRFLTEYFNPKSKFERSKTVSWYTVWKMPVSNIALPLTTSAQLRVKLEVNERGKSSYKWVSVKVVVRLRDEVEYISERSVLLSFVDHGLLWCSKRYKGTQRPLMRSCPEHTQLTNPLCIHQQKHWRLPPSLRIPSGIMCKTGIRKTHSLDEQKITVTTGDIWIDITGASVDEASVEVMGQ